MYNKGKQHFRHIRNELEKEFRRRKMSEYTVYGGEIVNGQVISSGDYYCSRMDVKSGGTANYTSVYAGGSLSISSGGVANSTFLSGGENYYYDDYDDYYY